MPEQTIIDKIRKLQALAERAGTEAEAAVAVTRVQELLTKHNLEIGDAVLKEDPGASLEAGPEWHRRVPYRAVVLAEACCKMFDVMHYMRQWPGRYWRIVFVGLKANVEAATITFPYLVESVESLAKGAKARNEIYGSAEFQGFRLGAAERIRRMAHDQKSQATGAEPRYAQLMHIANAQAAKMYGSIKFTSSYGGGECYWGRINDGYHRGYAEGGRVDLSAARGNRMLK